MSAVLAENPLLTLFLVVGVGAVLGAIRFGPLRFGAAGALFVGLALSAWRPELGSDMAIVQQIGLAFFVYTVGVGAGASFFRDLRRRADLLVTCAVVCVVGAGVAVVGGGLLGLDRGLVTGLYTGALTAAPALDAATRVTGDPAAAVGYAFGYPIGVIVGIIVVTMVATRKWLGERDTPSLAAHGLEAVTLRIRETLVPRHVPVWEDQRIRMSYLCREHRTRVVVPGEELREGDLLLVVGDHDAVKEAEAEFGDPIPENLADDRSSVAWEWMVVSDPDVAARAVGDLNLPVRFGAVITRVRRGDMELLARDDLVLQLGDRIAVAVPTEELDDVMAFVGDSERRVAEVDAMALGIGLVLGMLLGAVQFPMGGGATFQLGSAAGPLIVGMMLGALRRTGPLVWTLPESANLTIRQIGLLLFLAALGLGAGPRLASLLASPDGWRAAVLSAVIAAVGCGLFVVGARLCKLSAPRAAGGVAGFLGQPAVLQAASAQVSDERIENAYATLFAFAIIVKILLVPLIWSIGA